MPRFLVTLERTVAQYADYAVDGAHTHAEAVAHVRKLCENPRGQARLDAAVSWRTTAADKITILDESDTFAPDPGTPATVSS